jgi:hypothetical protein
MDDDATLLNGTNYQPLHPHWVGLQTILRDVLPVARDTAHELLLLFVRGKLNIVPVRILARRLNGVS